MNVFKSIFGIETSAVKKLCVLTPFLTKEMAAGLCIEMRDKGTIYSCGSNDIFTVIRTGMGTAFLGDAVLYLRDTPCETIIMFGSCGATGSKNNLNLGNLTIVKKAWVQDSFINMLAMKKPQETYCPNKKLETAIHCFNKTIKANCLTVSSLKLEESILELLPENTIDIIDMECGVFYAAANHIKKRAVALLAVTDILGQYPYYASLTAENKSSLKRIMKDSSKKVYEIIKGFNKPH